MLIISSIEIENTLLVLELLNFGTISLIVLDLQKLGTVLREYI